MLKGHSEPLRKAVVRFEELTADEKVRAAAFKREREILAEKSRMHTAKTEGLEEGRQEGRQEEKRRIARSLLQMALPIGQIVKATGLTEEEIRELQQ